MDMDLLAAKVSELAGFVWNGLLLYLLVGTGIIFTIRTRFIQVRKFGAGFRRLFGSVNLNGEKAGKEGMSSFQAVATSIAAQVGTGNITGCATAMISGGPGAIFWMWLAAFFGMATIYGEAVLAQTFKTKDETGHVIGGPVYYIRQAFKGTFGKILAGFFALAIIFALGFTGNMVQSNAISNAFQEALGIPTWIDKRPSRAKLCQKETPGNIPSLIRLTLPVQTRQAVSTSRRPRIVRFLMVWKKLNNRKREQQKAPNGIPI